MAPEPCGEAQSHHQVAGGHGGRGGSAHCESLCYENCPPGTQSPSFRARLCSHAPPSLYLPVGLPLGSLETLPKAKMLGLNPLLNERRWESAEH